jgi:hypothetical protein
MDSSWELALLLSDALMCSTLPLLDCNRDILIAFYEEATRLAAVEAINLHPKKKEQMIVWLGLGSCVKQSH